MRVFLTGATGFVGAPVTERLLARGHEVHALVHPEDGAPLDGRVSIVRGDLLRAGSYAAALEALRPEACVHLGWYANPKDYLSSRVNLDLLSASAALGAKLVDLGCARIVAAGTCFEYDVAQGYLREDGPLAPRHLYSACKRALGEVLAQLTAGTSTSLAWARLFFLYGPREQEGRLVRSVVDALLAGERARTSTGEQVRDFSHVADAAAGIVHVLESTLAGPVNVASGVPVRVRDVVRTIARLAGREDAVDWGAVTPRPNDPPFVCADVSKLRNSGFVPTFDLESGLRDTMEWAKGELGR
ncbi:MAG: NAD(P)-dependent oxidoreductase [Labilithrix sp.]|nr:NAD(P)-dependent oxidoreductase [Labilithrix sp.]MCW5816961.1 NAD(P)-dependent oxidoreductase [Labilithrix sp.]